MSFSILVPEINAKPTNTKDAVITMLALEWPLSLKTIYSKIKRKYGYSSTYQAVYKAVKELVEMQVLIEKEKRYEINIEWVKRVQSFTDIVETNYYAKERVESLGGVEGSKKGKDLLVLNFESIFDAEKYLYYFMKSELLKIKKDTVCHMANHEWRPIFYLRTEYNYYRKLKKRGHRFFYLCSGNSEMEKNCIKFYKNIGLNYNLIKEKFTNDTLVFGGYFIHIFIGEEKQSRMAELLEKKDTLKLLEEVLEAKSMVRVVINKDPALAEEIKKQTVKRFKI